MNKYKLKFDKTFEQKIVDNYQFDEVLDEGKFDSFVRRHLGPIAALGLGAASMTPSDSFSDTKPKTEMSQKLYQKDITIIAKTLYGEARGEGESGMRDVASVIYHRAKGDKNKYATKCLEKYQFAVWNNKTDIQVDPKSNSYKIATKIAEEMMTGKFTPQKFDGVTNPEFYCNTTLFNSDKIYTNPKLEYIKKVKESGKYDVKGNHVFYNLIKSPSVTKK